MIEFIEQNRPNISEIPNLIRLVGAEIRARTYMKLASEQLAERGLYPSTREGIWMYIVNLSLEPYDVTLSKEQSVVVMDMFTIIRRIYKSADDAWDSSPGIRDRVVSDSQNVFEKLEWKNGEIDNITHLTPVLQFLAETLQRHYRNDDMKQANINNYFLKFIKKSTQALIEFESKIATGTDTLEDSILFYEKTTGAIGTTIGLIVAEVAGTDNKIREALVKNFRQASLVSQLVDDMRDIPIDIDDDRSPSLAKTVLHSNPEELIALSEYARKRGVFHLSYRQFQKFAPKTAEYLYKTLFTKLTKDLPANLQRFLEDFFIALPPVAVSHKQRQNKNWHTSNDAYEMLVSES